jgi:anti-sigma regulatory factor (Ser/Thr protein kinase)
MSAAPFTAASPQQALHAKPAAGTRTFARRAEEVPAARRFVRATLAGHPSADDAELLACELVTNAVQHAADAAMVTVSVFHRGPIVHVDVMDDGKTGLPHWREANSHDEGGRGFQLVNEIAHRWGFLREQGGTCVWFELDPG